jgi:ribose 5-phosphate isomerase B
MRVAFGCDHGGWCLRETLLETLRDDDHEVVDVGAYSAESSDHPDFAAAVARKVASGAVDAGVLVCGTGVGMAIAANKVRGAYAANVSETYSARMARLHNGANIVTLGGRTVGPELAREVVRVFLSTEMDPGLRYERRRTKIRELEQADLQ